MMRRESEIQFPVLPRRLVVRTAVLLLGCVSGCVHYQARPLSPGQTAADFDARTLASDELRQFIVTSTGRSLPEWPPRQWDLEALTLAAFYFHPSLEVARAQWRVALARIQGANARPNPAVGLTPGYSTNSAAGVSPWFPLLAIDVPFETAGKRGYRVAIAEGSSEAVRLNVVSVAWQVRKNLQTAIIALAEAEHRQAALQRWTEIQEAMVARLDQRFAAGIISSYELATARMALQKLRLDLSDAGRRRNEDLVRLADAVGIPVRALEHVALATPWELPAAADLASTAYRQQALTNRPDVRALLAEYAAAQAALQLEIAKQFPDVHLGTGYQFDQGEHKWSLGLTFEIPLFNRNQGPIFEATAKRLEVAARFEALQAKVIAAIDLATATSLNALSRVHELDDLLTSQRRRRDAILGQLTAGAADQLDLLAAQAEVAQGELLKTDGQVQALLALALLEDAVQRPDDSWSVVEVGRGRDPTPKERP